MSGTLSSHSRQMATTDYYNGRLRFDLDSHENKLGREGRKAIGKYGTSPPGGTSSPTALRAMLDEKQKDGGSWSSGSSTMKRSSRSLGTSSRPARTVHYSDNELPGSKVRYTSLSPPSTHRTDANFYDSNISSLPPRSGTPSSGTRNFLHGTRTSTRPSSPESTSSERYEEPRPFSRDHKKALSTSCSRDCAQRHIVSRGDMTAHRYHFRDQMQSNESDTLSGAGTSSSFRHIVTDHLPHKDSLDLIPKRGIKHAALEDDFKTHEIKHKDSLSLVTNCRKINSTPQKRDLFESSSYGLRYSSGLGTKNDNYDTTVGMTSRPSSGSGSTDADIIHSSSHYSRLYESTTSPPKSSSYALSGSKGKMPSKDISSGRTRTLATKIPTFKEKSSHPLPVWKLPKNQTHKGT